MTQFRSLEGGSSGLGTTSDKLRRSGLLSAGEVKYKNVNFDQDTAKRVRDIVSELDAAIS